MIPVEVGNRLRLTLPDLPQAPQPVQSAQQVSDVLSDLVPGQRILAEIQALLPNGTYRAVVGQRDITLALPFSAKSGDSLELEVTESDGKLNLAFVANRGEAAAKAPANAVATTLSQTGRLIGDILAGVDDHGKKAPPAALNSNQPLLAAPPENGADLVPLLKEALSKSGMFYEAQQARWVAGKTNSEALFAQPQGKLSPALQDGAAFPANAQTTSAAATHLTTDGSTAVTANAVRDDSLPTTVQKAHSETQNTAVPKEILPLVQQQLDALATQNYVWQGQAWPGQPLHWEIREEGEKREKGSEEEAARWQTRLQLTLPSLGGIEATIHLRSAREVSISLVAESATSLDALNNAANRLRQQFEAAGLTLGALNISHDEVP